MRTISLFEILFDTSKKINKREYPKLENMLLNVTKLQPKKSKMLSTNFIKKMFLTNDNITLILLGHLYIERLLNEIITINFNYSTTNNKNSKINTFYKKIAYLKNKGVIAKNVADDIIIINELRNCFAHKLNYQLSNFDLWRLSELKKYSRECHVPKNKKLKEVYNRVILKIYFFNLIINLPKEFRYLYLLNDV